MPATLTVHPFAAEAWALYQDLRLRALADAPEAFGSTLAHEQNRSDADWSARLAAGVASGWDLPLLAEVDGQPAGLAWGNFDASDRNVAHLYQMWVAPGQRGHGVGQKLLETVIDWARAKHAAYLELGVTVRDSPAMRLYQRAGFQIAGLPEPLRPGAQEMAVRMRLIL